MSARLIEEAQILFLTTINSSVNTRNLTISTIIYLANTDVIFWNLGFTGRTNCSPELCVSFPFLETQKWDRKGLKWPENAIINNVAVKILDVRKKM